MPSSIFSKEHGAFVEALAVVRREAGVTQVQLSKELGRNQSYISNIERGQRRLDVTEFAAIARALNRDPAKLFAQLIQGTR